jgi:hypothetical protein
VNETVVRIGWAMRVEGATVLRMLSAHLATRRHYRCHEANGRMTLRPCICLQHTRRMVQLHRERYARFFARLHGHG